MHVPAPPLTPQGEDVIREGEVGAEMYFIARGSVSVRTSGESPPSHLQIVVNELVVSTLQQGHYFGEMSLLSATPLKRTATVRTVTPVELYVLKQDDLNKVLGFYPEIRWAMKMMAKMRSKALGAEAMRKSSIASSGRPGSPSPAEIAAKASAANRRASAGSDADDSDKNPSSTPLAPPPS